MADLFSDREGLRHPRATSEIDNRTWLAILAMVERRLSDGTLGYKFPENCRDTPSCIGVAVGDFNDYVNGHVPGVFRAITEDNGAPPTNGILDFIELVAEGVGRPIERGYHSYFSHSHFTFDRDAGLADFVEEVNRLFRRAGTQFEMNPAGRIQRLGPPLLRDMIRRSVFRTGDATLDELLRDACNRILSRNANENRFALEKLWDAFERTKTLEPGPNKPAQIATLLDRTAAGTGPRFRAAIETEAATLNRIGNDFQIRHHDHSAEALPKAEQIDALFFRLFSFLALVFASTGRM